MNVCDLFYIFKSVCIYIHVYILKAKSKILFHNILLWEKLLHLTKKVIFSVFPQIEKALSARTEINTKMFQVK